MTKYMSNFGESEKKITVKQKVLKTIYHLTFVPYIMLITYAICRTIFGINVWETVYLGFEAFEIAIIFLGAMYLPVFIICLIYQILFKLLTRKHIEYKQYNSKLAVIVVVVVSIILSLLSQWRSFL